jgi:hypothetical protein
MRPAANEAAGIPFARENAMPQRLSFKVAAVVGLLLVATCWHGFAAEEKADSGKRTANARARRDAAKAVYEGSWQRHLQAPEDLPFDLTYFHGWSVRWLQAERDTSSKKAEQIAALEGHLKRMQFFKDRVEKARQDSGAPAYELQAAEFFVLEADEWLAAAKAEQK